MKSMSKPIKKLPSVKYRIVVEMPFGVFPSLASANEAKARMKKKSSRITFSTLMKTAGGYKFVGKLTFIKAIAAPANIVKQAVQSKTPGAKVTVTRA